MTSKVRKRDLISSARIISYVGGVLYVLAGGILFLDYFMHRFSLDVGSRILLYLFGIEINAGTDADVLILAIICIVIGAGIIILIGAEPDHLLTGILLLVLAIIGLGAIAIFPLAGGILFIIAFTRKR